MSSSPYLSYITEEEEVCDGCGKTLPKGTQCEATEDYLYCMSCVVKLEATADMDYDDFRETFDDNFK